MDWTAHFERLTAPQQLGVAAAFAERVLPLAGGVSALDDGLALVWLQVGGRATKKIELARALNTAIESAQLTGEDKSARAYAARAVFSVLEAALHNPHAPAAAIECALAAARTLGETAGTEEAAWITWAVEVAASCERPTRATFIAPDAPQSSWRTSVSSDDLPLFAGAD